MCAVYCPNVLSVSDETVCFVKLGDFESTSGTHRRTHTHTYKHIHVHYTTKHATWCDIISYWNQKCSSVGDDGDGGERIK